MLSLLYNDYRFKGLDFNTGTMDERIYLVI